MATIAKGRITFTEAASEGKFGYVKGTCKWAELLKAGQFGDYNINMYGDNVIEMREELEAMQQELDN